MSREQGDIKIDLGSTEDYFGGHQEHNLESREKRVKLQREPGAGDPPYGVSRLHATSFGVQELAKTLFEFACLHCQLHPLHGRLVGGLNDIN